MINVTNLPAAGLWGAGLDRAGSLSGVAQDAAAQARASGAAELVTGSPMLLAVLAAGLALWLVGDRLFRPASSLLGAAIGALVGLVVAGAINAPEIAGIPTPYAAIGAGSVLGLAVGAALYRIAVGGAAGLTLAGVAAGVAAVVSLQTPDGDGAPERPETIAEVASARGASIEPVSFDGGVTFESLQAAAQATGSAVRAEWASLPESARNLMLAAAILGGVLGFAAGLLKPRTAGPAIAALAGTAMWLAATTGLLARTGQPLPALPTERPGTWLSAWLLVALVGFAVQRRVIRPAALVAKEDG